MNSIIKYVLLLIASLLYICLEAQQTIKARINDNIQLEADEYRGTIEWQVSTDQASWNSIESANSNPFTHVITNIPSYYRAKIIEEGCAPHFSEIISVIQNEILLWSDPNTWGNDGKPSENQQITIPPDAHILLDENTPNLAGLIIEGILEFDRKNLELTSDWIVIQGKLEVGTESLPFEHKAIITLTDTDTESDIMNMGTRGIMVMNGSLELHGAVTSVLWTKLDAHAQAGSTSLELIESVDWKIGDEIVIAPTDYYEAGNGASITQRVSLTNVSDKQVTISQGLNAHRWGRLQYATQDGMSLTSNNIVTPPVADTENTSTPLILDERAEIGNMTRNIVIQSANDALWNNDMFGVHTMIMPNAVAHVEGVEFKRAGQSGRLRRYPFHWHMLSYSGAQTLEDATGQYFRNNTINSSANRGVVIHGTNGVEVQNNIIYDVKGHGIFTEDAVERRNIIDGNLVLHVRNPAWGFQLLEHEIGELGSSGFWISNPDNIVRNNVAADCQTFGYWLAFPEHPWGLSQDVLHSDGLVLRPNRLLFGVFDNNTSHSQKNDGIHLDSPQIDAEGNVYPIQYWSTTDGRGAEGTLRRFSLSRYKTWKNRDNGAWDRAPLTDIFEVVSADNCGRFFAGSGSDGVIERSLVVGTSLNYMMNGTGRPEIADFQFNPSSAPTAFATYHGAFSMRENVVINFPVTEHDRMGVFATDDYYVRAVEKGHIRNYNNLLIQSHPGVKLKSNADYFTFSSALWDPYGFWGPPDNYFVYDDPFLTYGKDISIVELGISIAGGVSVPGPFYGFRGFVLHGVGWEENQSQPFNDFMKIHVRRLDPENLSNEIAIWSVESAMPNWSLAHMRDFATTPNGIYELTFPDEPTPPTNYQMYVENMLERSDTQVIGIEFDGEISDPTVLLRREDNWNNYQVYTKVGSLTEVINSEGETWWQDVANDRVWVKLRGGVWQEKEDDSFEETINEIMVLKIWVPD